MACTHALRRDVVDHVRAPLQDLQAAAADLAVQALCLAVADDLVGVAGEDRRGREQRTVTLAQHLGGRDHVRRILRKSADLGGPQRQCHRELRRKPRRDALRREHLLDEPGGHRLADQRRDGVTEQIAEQGNGRG